MTRSSCYMRLLGLLFLATTLTAPALGDPPGRHWYAYTNATYAITGDMYLSDHRVTFSNGKFLRIRFWKIIKDFHDENGNFIPATIYKVLNQKNQVLLHNNRLRPGEPRVPIKLLITWPADKRADPELVAPLAIQLGTFDTIPHKEYELGTCSEFIYDVRQK